MERKTRKHIRLQEYDYDSGGVYFITVCVKDRKPILWEYVGADIIRPESVPLSKIGEIVNTAIRQIPEHYPHMIVDKYCIMPDHIHLLLTNPAEQCGRMISAPTISTVVGQMKRWVSKQAGISIWQKSFIDRVIRNQKGYLAAWEYIENNPIKMDCADDKIDFTQM